MKNLDMWKFIARDLADDQDCWVSTHEPEWQHDDGVWSCCMRSMCELAEALGIPEEFWPAPGECRPERTWSATLTSVNHVYERSAGVNLIFRSVFPASPS